MNGHLFEGTSAELQKVGASISGVSIEDIFVIVGMANQAKQASYAPYSHFNVGVAGVFERHDGETEVFAGANQENVAYSPTQCGETVAIAQARFEGYHTIKALAVCGGLDSTFDSVSRKAAAVNWVAPCGRCRQVICETAAPDCIIVLVRGDGRLKIITFAALFPFSFGPQNLGIDPAAYRP